jgi:hypothetical protein
VDELSLSSILQCVRNRFYLLRCRFRIHETSCQHRALAGSQFRSGDLKKILYDSGTLIHVLLLWSGVSRALQDVDQPINVFGVDGYDIVIFYVKLPYRDGSARFPEDFNAESRL